MKQLKQEATEKEIRLKKLKKDIALIKQYMGCKDIKTIPIIYKQNHDKNMSTFMMINNICEDIEKLNRLKISLEDEIEELKTPLSKSDSRFIQLTKLRKDILKMRSNGEHYANQISEEREYVNQIKDNLLLLINKMADNSKEGIAKKWINSHGDKAVENIPDREVRDALGIVDDEISKLLYKYECYRNNTDYYNVSPTYSHRFNSPTLPSMGNDVFEETDEAPLSREELYKEIEMNFGDIHRPYPPSLRKQGRGGSSSKKLIRNSFVRNSTSKPRPFLSPLSQQPPITVSNQNSSSSNDEISQQLMEEILNADITENDMKSESKSENESFKPKNLFGVEKDENNHHHHRQQQPITQSNEIKSDLMTVTINEDVKDNNSNNINQISNSNVEENKTMSKNEVEYIDDDFYNYEENEVEEDNINNNNMNKKSNKSIHQEEVVEQVEVNNDNNNNNESEDNIVDDFEAFSKSKSSVFSQESQHRLSRCVSEFVNQLLDSIVDDIKPVKHSNENKESIPQPQPHPVSSIYSSKSSIKFEDSNVLNNEKSKSSTNSLSFKSSTVFKESFSTDDIEKKQIQQQQEQQQEEENNVVVKEESDSETKKEEYEDNLSRCVSQFINQLVGAIADEMKLIKDSKNSSKSSLKQYSSKSLHSNYEGKNKNIDIRPTIEENKEEDEKDDEIDNFDDDVFKEESNVEETEGKEVDKTKEEEKNEEKTEDNNEIEDEELVNNEEVYKDDEEETNENEEGKNEEEENEEEENENNDEEIKDKVVEDEGVGCGTDDMGTEVDFEYKEGMNSHFIHPSDFQPN